MQAAGQGMQLRLRAFVRVQDESDANAKDAPEYGKNLGEMRMKQQMEVIQ
jgi:hypothetical protein